jgi:hypothetical protein
MQSGFKNNRNQDAAATIRGFLYQAYQTIDLWLQLNDGEQLELEKGEDVDIVKENDARDLIQVKDLISKITLRDKNVGECLFNWYQHQKTNPNFTLKFCFLTTATTTKEKGSQFPNGKCGIEIWQEIHTDKCTDKDLALKEIKKILLEAAQTLKGKQSKKQNAAWDDWVNYLNNVKGADLEIFIKGFYFLPAQQKLDDLRNAIGIALLQKKKATTKNLESRIQTFLTYVFHKLSEPGKKILTVEEITTCVDCNSTNELKELNNKLKDLEDFYSPTNFLQRQQLHEYPNQESVNNYKKSIRKAYKNWNVPQEVIGWEEISTKQFDPKEIHRFKEKATQEDRLSTLNAPLLKYRGLGQRTNQNIWIFEGNTGLGKTVFLKCLNYEFASIDNPKIPIYIPLRKISSQNTLKKLILNELNQNDYEIKEEQLFKLLKNHPFTLLLDAYDEVDKTFIRTLKEEIGEFERFCKIIITTRPVAVLKLPKSTTFELQPLEYDRVKSIVIEYIGESSYYDFIKKIEQHGLLSETKNILLLLLFIGVYRKHGQVPASNSELIKTIVDDIFTWVSSKNTAENSWFTKNVIEDILEQIAYIIYSKNSKTQLLSEEIDKFFFEYIEDKAKLRQIPQEETIAKLKHRMAQIGILIFNKNGEIYFWHRLFLNHFATISFAKKITAEEIDLKKVIVEYHWIIPLINCPPYLPEKKQIEFLALIEDNLWLIAEALANVLNPSKELLQETIQRLKVCCVSGIFKIRMHGIHYLKILNQKHRQYTSPVIWELFNSTSLCVEVRRIAFLEIASEKSEAAQKLVFDHLDWDEGSQFNVIGTQEEVIKALSYCGEKGYWQMFELLKLRYSRISFSFDNVFSELITFNKLPEDLLQAIFDWFIEEFNDDNTERIHYKIPLLLGKIRKEGWISTLILTLKNAIIQNGGKLRFSNINIIRILEEYTSKECINLLWQEYNSPETVLELKRDIATILSKYQGDVPLTYYQTLIEEEDINCKKSGIKGLGRFEYGEIHLQLKDLLHHEECEIHRLAFEVSLENGFILELLKEDFITEDFLADCHWKTVFFLKAIAKYGLENQIDFIRDVINKNGGSYSILVHYLKALAANNLQDRLVETFKMNYFKDEKLKFPEENDCVRQQINKFEIIELLPTKTAIEMLTILYEQSINAEDLRNFSYYFDDAYKNNFSPDFSPFLKKLVIDSIEYNNVKNNKKIYSTHRYLLALSTMIKDDDESWLIDLFKKYPQADVQVRIKIISLLGRITKTKSAVELAKTTAKTTANGIILNSCYEILVTYNRRNGILRQIKESELFDYNTM